MSEKLETTANLSRKDLELLLQGQFGEHLRVNKLCCESANKTGDNYGSALLSLEVDLTNKDKSENHYIIAKSIPPTKFLQEVFDVSVTFCKEINLYKLLYPELMKLQRECGIEVHDVLNLVAKFYGARTSFDNGDSDVTDFDAVLLLGNLKKEGFQLADRLTGLDLNHCKLALNNLAAFHALVIALRMKKPSIFHDIMPTVTASFHIGVKNIDEKEEINEFLDTLEKNVPECLPFIDDVRKSIMSHMDVEQKAHARKPFATLVHNDFWTNNMMFKYQTGSNEPTSVKFLDFQLTLHCSPIRDIVFFLYSSAQSYVFQEHFEDLINLYYDTFITQLKKLKCDVNVFSKSAFLKELDYFAPIELHHILFMTAIIYVRKEDAEDLKNISSTEHLQKVGGNNVSRKKVMEIITEFNKRGWLREYADESL